MSNVIRVCFATAIRACDTRSSNDNADTARAYDSASKSEAETLYRRACSLDNNTAPVLAARLYKRAIALDPMHSNAMVNLATLYYSAAYRWPKRAVRLYKRALAIDPTCSEVLYNLGNMRLERGHCRAAIRLLRASLATSPKFADAHYNLAAALTQTGRLRLARAHWRLYLKCEAKTLGNYEWRRYARAQLSDPTLTIVSGQE